MPLESAATIDQLVTTNPPGSDGMSQGDDHIRLIKLCLHGTFPNFTGNSGSGLTSTEAAIDTAVTAVNTTGVSVLADAGVHFKTNTTDEITNPVAGEIDVTAGGTLVAKFKSTPEVEIEGPLKNPAAQEIWAGGNKVATFNTDQTTNFVGPITAPGIVGMAEFPIGGGALWFDDNLPVGTGGVVWAWANGQAISRTTYSTLWGRWGTFYGAGDGVTTFNLPDLREVAPVGKGTMGSTITPARITNYVTNVLGTFIGACLHLLTTGEMPSHTHTPTVTDPGHTHTLTDKTHIRSDLGADTSFAPGVNNIKLDVDPSIAIQNATTGITVANANTGGGGSHDNVSPGFICNFIIRIA